MQSFDVLDDLDVLILAWNMLTNLTHSILTAKQVFDF